MQSESVSKLDLDAKNRFIQFEVWKDCKNGCSFCFNRGLPDKNKLECLDFIMKKLDDPIISMFNEIGFIGGEFFDDQLRHIDVKKKFFTMFNKVFNLVKSGQMNKVYVTSSLTFQNQDLLFEFFDFVKSNDVISHFLLCTSYDTIGRFKEMSESNWKKNMLDLKQRYPEMKLHTEMIMTQDFIDKVLSRQFDIIKFQDEFNTTIDYLEPNTGSFYDGKEEFNKHIPNFLPKRQDFIKFLNKTCIEDKSIELFKLFSKQIRSDLIYLILNGEYVEICGRRGGARTLGMNLPIMPKFGYIDSNIDIADDVAAFRELYG